MKSLAWKRVLWAACLCFAGGCTNTINACPALKTWTPDEQKELRRELEISPDSRLLYDALEDYKRMRDDARACGA